MFCFCQKLLLVELEIIHWLGYDQKVLPKTEWNTHFQRNKTTKTSDSVSHITSTFFQTKKNPIRHSTDDPSPFLIGSYNLFLFLCMMIECIFIHSFKLCVCVFYFSSSSFFSYLFVCILYVVVVLMSFLNSSSSFFFGRIHSFHDLWMQRKFNSSVFSLFCHYNGAFFLPFSLYVWCTIAYTPYYTYIVRFYCCTLHTVCAHKYELLLFDLYFTLGI